MNINVRVGEFIVIIIVCLASISLLVSSYQKKNEYLKRETRIATSSIINASISDISGTAPVYMGDPRSPFTLVEYGDYQCPPCHRAALQVIDLMNQYQGKLKFVFRNLPLTTIHPFAMQAAISAEFAKKKGAFWSLHSKLYTIKADHFNNSSIEKALLSVGITKKEINYSKRSSEYLKVEKDIQQAKRLGLNATPTFILCCPNNMSYKLDNVNDVGVIVDSNEFSRAK